MFSKTNREGSMARTAETPQSGDQSKVEGKYPREDAKLIEPFGRWRKIARRGLFENHQGRIVS